MCFVADENEGESANWQLSPPAVVFVRHQARHSIALVAPGAAYNRPRLIKLAAHSGVAKFVLQPQSATSYDVKLLKTRQKVGNSQGLMLAPINNQEGERQHRCEAQPKRNEQKLSFGGTTTNGGGDDSTC